MFSHIRLSVIIILYLELFFTFPENRVENEVQFHSVDQQSSTNDDSVEAIAEAFPEVPIEGTVQYDQGETDHEVIPLSVAPQAPKLDISNTVRPDEQQQIQTTETPKKKVHISLDIPDNTEIHDETESDEDDAYAPQRPQKPNRPSPAANGGSPTYTFFPVTFGRAAGGTIAVANAYSTGKGAVRSHAIAYGSNAASRRQAIERHIAAQKRAH